MKKLLAGLLLLLSTQVTAMTSYDGYELIKKFEGFRGSIYIEQASGKPHIGYGLLLTDKQAEEFKDLVVTETQAEIMLMLAVVDYEQAINKYVTVNLNQNQYDALVSFTYNVGIGAFKRSTLLRKLNRGDYFGAAEQFQRWKYSRGKVVPGLVKRRALETKLFNRGGDYATIRDIHDAGLRPTSRVRQGSRNVDGQKEDGERVDAGRRWYPAGSSQRSIKRYEQIIQLDKARNRINNRLRRLHFAATRSYNPTRFGNSNRVYGDSIRLLAIH